MRVFVTGATGYIGSAVVRELVGAGHEVSGLTRSAEKSSSLEELGSRPIVGDLSDPSSYRAAALEADALVHVAAEESGARTEVDRLAVDVLLGVVAESAASSLVYTSGCFVLGETGDEPAHEDASTADAPELVAWRPGHERRVLSADRQGLATSVIRPGMVYGGREGMFAMFFESAEGKGAAEFVGDGANRWSPVYRGDVARLYRLVVEERASGIFHAAEPAELVGKLAMAASRAAGVGGATERVRVEDARVELGAFADALTMDQVMGCHRSRQLGWVPAHLPFTESAESVYREWKGERPAATLPSGS